MPISIETDTFRIGCYCRRAPEYLQFNILTCDYFELFDWIITVILKNKGSLLVQSNTHECHVGSRNKLNTKLYFISC